MTLLFRGSRPRLQRAFRRNGRSTSELVATGPLAVCLAAIEDLERAEREAARSAERAEFEAERRRVAGLHRTHDKLARHARAIAAGVMREAGYYQPQPRGPWRKRAMPNEIRPTPVGASPGPRRVLNLNRGVANALVKFVAGDDAEKSRLLHADLARVADELAGPDPTAAELLLAESAAFDWYLAQAFRVGYVHRVGKPGGVSLGHDELSAQRVDRTHKRLLGTLKMLETLRALALPALQVNIGEKQVNVVNPTRRRLPK